MSKSKVFIRAFEGKVIVQSKNNPLYGSVRIEQTVNTTSNGFLTPKKRSAFINGLMADLEGQGWYDGQAIDGDVIVKESLTPFNADNPDGDIKMAGDSGVPCTLEGSAIYRRASYSLSGGEDTLVSHDNSEEIKAAQAKVSEDAITD